MPLKQDDLNLVNSLCPGTKRQRLQSPKKINNTLVPLDSKKCGEVLVTSNADKWTFVCTYCQKVIGDIGVFICHIKMEHLSDQQHSEKKTNAIVSENETSNDTTANNVLVLDPLNPKPFHSPSLNKVNQQQNKFPEILEVTSLAVQEEKTTGDKNRPTSSVNTVKKSILPHTTEKREKQHSNNENHSKEIYEVIYLSDDNKKDVTDPNTCIMIDDDDNDDVINDTADVNTQFSYSVNDEVSNDNDLEIVDCDKEDDSLMPTSSSNSKKSRLKKIDTNTDSLPHKCSYCNKGFKSKQAIHYHHKTHEKKSQLQCPVCPISHCTEHLFISHVLSHESDTCFPCQVCGQISPTNEKRMEHLKIHEIDRPFGCTFCYRRFRKKHFLTNHLRMHCQYLCDFCPVEFHAPQAQRRPYVCPTCEASPDIRRKVEQQRSLAAKNHIFESDQE